MSDEDRPSAMRRKAGAGRPPPEIGQVTAGSALRAALAQAAEDVAGLVVVAGQVEEARTTLVRVSDGLAEHALLALVEGPGSRFGLVVLDAQATAALIEVQTTGRVVPRPAEPRPPTRTDAVMCADFIDQVLELLEGRAAEAELDLTPALTGFRYALALPEPRAIAMTLDDVPYRQMACSLNLGQGAKEGRIQLILPFDPPGPGPRHGQDHKAFAAALEAQVLGSRAVLTATLARRELPLAEVAALEVGSVIALPRDALGQVAIEDLSGAVVVHGRLGQVNGHRALRISFDPVPEDDRDADARRRALQGPGLAGGPDAGARARLSDLDPPGELAGLAGAGPGADPDGLPDLPGRPDLRDLPGGTDPADLPAELPGELTPVPALPDLP